MTAARLSPVILALTLASCGCETLISDSATRIAYAVRDGAARLRGSKSGTLVLSVAWRSRPDGCPDGYRVEWRADGEKYPGLAVDCDTGRRSYGTTYYRTFVKVPNTLRVSHAKGDPTTIALRKAPNDAIEVVELR